MHYLCSHQIFDLKNRWIILNNPEKSSTTKLGEHIPCGYLVPAIWVFDNIKNEHTLYHGEDCMKKFFSYENMLQM